MGPDTIWVFIPITAIVLGIGAGVVKHVLDVFERVQMARLQASKSATGLNDDLVAQLRQEITLLRDTTTQHAISLQHAMERIDHRVEFLERKSSMPVGVEAAQPTDAQPPVALTRSVDAPAPETTLQVEQAPLQQLGVRV